EGQPVVAVQHAVAQLVAHALQGRTLHARGIAPARAGQHHHRGVAALPHNRRLVTLADGHAHRTRRGLAEILHQAPDRELQVHQPLLRRAHALAVVQGLGHGHHGHCRKDGGDGHGHQDLHQGEAARTAAHGGASHGGAPSCGPPSPSRSPPPSRSPSRSPLPPREETPHSGARPLLRVRLGLRHPTAVASASNPASRSTREASPGARPTRTSTRSSSPMPASLICCSRYQLVPAYWTMSRLVPVSGRVGWPGRPTRSSVMRFSAIHCANALSRMWPVLSAAPDSTVSSPPTPSAMTISATTTSISVKPRDLLMCVRAPAG